MTASSVEHRAPIRALEGKYLNFTLADEAYGFAILDVDEIVGMMPVTPVPHSHPCIRGVVNLRGRVIPIVDLRRRFGMPDAGAPETCIVVLRTRGQLVGVAVDSVTDVRRATAGEIEPPPSFGGSFDASCIVGIAKTEGKVRMLLDAERVLAADPVPAA